MTTIHDVYGSNSELLSKDELEVGKDYPVVIEHWDTHDFDDGPKIILKFKDRNKKFAVNITNARTLERAFGPVETWLGKKIILFRNNELSFGKMDWIIRVRVPPEEYAEETAADVPF